jgi:hypothetical protein
MRCTAIVTTPNRPTGRNDKKTWEPTNSGGPLPNFTFTVPAGSQAEVRTREMPVSRLDGPTPPDEVFRARLYAGVGAIAVAGGHVEAALKRLLLFFKATDKYFEDVDISWTALERKLRAHAEADPTQPQRKRLGRVLDWGMQNEVKRRRDDAIHAYWWNYDGVGLHRSRFPQNRNGLELITTWTDLAEDAELLFQYARRLEDLLEDHWPQIILDKP